MKKTFKKFAVSDDGAVTVDWIVLTAAVVVLCIYGIASVQQGITNLVHAIEAGVSVPVPGEDP